MIVLRQKNYGTAWENYKAGAKNYRNKPLKERFKENLEAQMDPIGYMVRNKKTTGSVWNSGNRGFGRVGEKAYSKLSDTLKGSGKGLGWGAGIGYATGAGLALYAGDGLKDAHKAGKLGAIIGAGMGVVNGGRVGYKNSKEEPKKVTPLTAQELKQLLPPQYSKWLRIAKDGKTIQLQKEINKLGYKIYPMFRVPELKNMLEEYNESGSCSVLDLIDYGPSVSSMYWCPTTKSWVNGSKNPDEDIKYAYDCFLEELLETFEIEDDKFLGAVETFMDHIKSKL